MKIEFFNTQLEIKIDHSLTSEGRCFVSLGTIQILINPYIINKNDTILESVVIHELTHAYLMYLNFSDEESFCRANEVMCKDLYLLNIRIVEYLIKQEGFNKVWIEKKCWKQNKQK